jgi:D-alanine-D-alanine ligase
MEKKVKIIYNDDGCELDPERYALESILYTAREIEEGLKEAGYATSLTPLVDREDHVESLTPFVRELIEDRDSMVFNLCEAAFEVSTFEMHVAALLELYDIRYTGSPPFALGLALDKGLSKDVLKGRGILTPVHCVLGGPDEELDNALEFPLIVKPLREDASAGIDMNAVVQSTLELRERVEYIVANYYQPAIAEEYIDGREFNISVLGNGQEKRALPPAELKFVDFPEGQPKIVCYESKWVAESPLYKKTVPECPADVDGPLAEELCEAAVKAYEAMGCRDYARVDMRLGTDNRLMVIEVNPNPDLSSDAGLARAARAEGLDYTALVSRIVEIAEARYSSAEKGELICTE